jgi:type IV secretory pathway VirB10-like protein
MMAARKTGWMIAATVAGGALLGACNRGPSEREKQLEQRVQELEQQQAASPDPSAFPEVVLESPRVPPAYAAAPEPPAARPAAPRAATSTRAHPSTTPRADTPRAQTRPGAPAAPSAPRAEPVERIGDDEARAADTDWPAGETPASREAAGARETQATVLPANTQLTLRLETPVSSRTSTAGDRVTARVERAVSDDGTVLLPGGTVLHGRVTEADGAGRVKGKARVVVSFDRIVVRGQSHPLEATVLSAEGPDSHERDAKVIGGSAVAGAIIGGIKGGKSGAVKGAVIGAGAGTGAVLVTKGKDVEMPAGSRWVVRTRNSIRL